MPGEALVLQPVVDGAEEGEGDGDGDIEGGEEEAESVEVEREVDIFELSFARRSASNCAVSTIAAIQFKMARSFS